MLTYFKVNSELALDWVEDDDLSVFIIVIATVQHEFRMSTYVVCNKKHQWEVLFQLFTVSYIWEFSNIFRLSSRCNDVTQKFNAVGCSTIKNVTHFFCNDTVPSFASPKPGFPTPTTTPFRQHRASTNNIHPIVSSSKVIVAIALSLVVALPSSVPAFTAGNYTPLNLKILAKASCGSQQTKSSVTRLLLSDSLTLQTIVIDSQQPTTNHKT